MAANRMSKVLLSLLIVISIVIVVCANDAEDQPPLPGIQDSASMSSGSLDMPSNTPSQVSTGLSLKTPFSLLKTVAITFLVLSGKAAGSYTQDPSKEDLCAKKTPVRDRLYVAGYQTQWGLSDKDYSPFGILEQPVPVNTVIYAFANIKDGEIDFPDSETDLKQVFPNPDPRAKPSVFTGAFDALNNPLSPLRLQIPNFRTLISIGGWTQSKYFSDVAQNDEARQKFSSSVASFVNAYGFDGVDIDWEYPTGGGAEGNIERPKDAVNFAKLLRSLRHTLYSICKFTKRDHPYLLTAALGSQYGPLSLPEIVKYLDWINVMTYDYYGPGWSDVTGYVAPIDFVKKTIQGYVDSGASRNQLMLGLPFYSYAYGGVKDSKVGSSFDPNLTVGDGTVDYRDVLANFTADKGYERWWDPVAMVPYIYNPITETWISTETPASIVIKALYAKANALGVFIWELDADNNKLLSSLKIAEEWPSPSTTPSPEKKSSSPSPSPSP